MAASTVKPFIAVAILVFALAGWVGWLYRAPSILILKNNAGLPLTVAARVGGQLIGSATLPSGTRNIYFFDAHHTGDITIACSNRSGRAFPVLHIGQVYAMNTGIALRHRITLDGCNLVASYDDGLLGHLLQ